MCAFNVVHLFIVVDEGPDDLVFEALLWKLPNLVLGDGVSLVFLVSSKNST